MTDFSAPMLAAAQERLRQDTALTTLVSGIYGMAQRSTPLPYIASQIVESRAYDHKTRQGQEARLQISAYATQPGYAVLHDIGRLINAQLHAQSFTIDGGSLVNCRLLRSQLVLQNRTKLVQLRQIYRVVVQSA